MADPARAELPEHIGRYQVIRLIGEGGMGRVFAARDPQLDREVALKLVASPGKDGTGEGGGSAQALLAEALAMARLSHPNVVAVHDAGLEGDQAFVAMELVEGVTLREWQSAQGRTWREVLRAYLEAGRGLAAAHRAGLTHGDFKPDNALVSADGRVRVTDFGLARATAVEGGGDGAVSAGTPGYMAPEQIAGARADPRSDQYGFCAALHEGLFGALPAASTAYVRVSGPKTVPIGGPAAPAPATASSLPGGRRAPGLRRMLGRGLSAAYTLVAGSTLVPPDGTAPLASTIPGGRVARIRRALERGLSAAAEERHPSMEALLEVLEQAAAPSRAWAVGAAAVVLAGAVAIPLVGVRGYDCEDEVSAISGAWDAPARQAVERALAGPAREMARARVLRALDQQAEAWTAMAKDACEATRVRREQSAEVLSLRTICLHQRLNELGAV
ncbi:MAG TPA: serine/threonine-protein kinase, partial [Myxococcales bacterium]|nr:serine/threonine-protein kinase [Myxococcales bacterium]